LFTSSAHAPQNGCGRKVPVQRVDPWPPRDTPRSVVDGSGRVGVRGRRRRCSMFCWSWTSDSSSSPELLLSASPHMSSAYDEMLWLTTCRNCRRVHVGVLALQTRLYALVIDDIGLLLCPPYCHSTNGASNVCLAVYGCTLKVRKKCEDVRVCKLDSRPERRMKALRTLFI